MASSSTAAVSSGAGMATHMNRLREDNFEDWLIRVDDYLTTNEIDVNSSKAAAVVRSCCDDAYLPIIGKLKTAKEIIAALTKYHAHKAQSNAFVQVKNLASIKKLPDEPILRYFTRAERLRTSLKEAGETMSDLMFVHHVLGGLPEDYNDVVQVLVNLDGKLTIESILPKLLAHESNLKNSPGTSDHTALAAWAIKNKNKQNKPRQDDTSSSHERGGLCDFCGRNNHTLDKCKFRERWENGGSAAYYAKHPQAHMAAVVKQPSTEEILYFSM